VITISIILFWVLSQQKEPTTTPTITDYSIVYDGFRFYDVYWKVQNNDTVTATINSGGSDYTGITYLSKTIEIVAGSTTPYTTIYATATATGKSISAQASQYVEV